MGHDKYLRESQRARVEKEVFSDTLMESVETLMDPQYHDLPNEVPESSRLETYYK